MPYLRGDRLIDGVRRRVQPARRSRRRDGREAGRPGREVRSLIVEYVPPTRRPEPSTEKPMPVLAPEPARAIAAARAGLGLPVEEVVERLRRALGLGENVRGRLTYAYEDLERDMLPPAGVHDSVWNALRDILRVDARRLAGGRGSRTPRPRDPDEVDLLFRGFVGR
jgi:hypothetical protein